MKFVDDDNDDDTQHWYYTCVSGRQRENGFAVSIVQMDKYGISVTHLGCYIHTGTTTAVNSIVVRTIKH